MPNQTIRAALTRLTALQAALEITDPIPVKVRKAWKYAPPSKVVIAPYSWVNDWSLNEMKRGSSLLSRWYTVSVQFWAGEPTEEISADVATAFEAVFIDALNADVRLGGAAVHTELRGNSPTLVLLGAAASNVGLQLYLDVHMKEAAAFS